MYLFPGFAFVIVPLLQRSINVCFQLTAEQGSFEGRVVVVCEKMMAQPCWVSSNQLVHSKSSRGMTLLHLAAAQGYAGLIQTLIRWRYAHKITHKHTHTLTHTHTHTGL